MKKYPTQEELKELFDYHPDGYLVWKKSKKKAGGFSFVDRKLTHVYRVTINGNTFIGDNLIYILINGSIKDGFYVRRINSLINPTIENLEVSNKKRIRDNPFRQKAKYKGVFESKSKGVIGYHKDYGEFCFSSELDAATWVDNIYENIDGVRPNGTEKKEISPNKKETSTARGRIKKNGKIGCYARSNGSYYARFRKNYLGTFKNQEEAARAYNIAAYKHYGENAVLNDIPDPLGSGF